MTGPTCIDKEFSRKTFLKGGGALIVGFSRARRLVAAGQGERGEHAEPAAGPDAGRLVAGDQRRQHA